MSTDEKVNPIVTAANKLKFKSIFEELKKMAQETILRDGDHAPLMLMFAKEKTIIFPVNLDNKNIFGELMVFAADLYQADYIFMISEAWMKTLKDGSKQIPQSLENEPDRVEILSVWGESRDGVSCSAYYEMVRGESGKLVKLTPIRNDFGSETTVATGRFTNYFTRKANLPEQAKAAIRQIVEQMDNNISTTSASNYKNITIH